MPGDVRFCIIVSAWPLLGRHKEFVSEIFIKEHPAMKTILDIDLDKRNSEFCKINKRSLKPEFSRQILDSIKKEAKGRSWAEIYKVDWDIAGKDRDF